MYLNFAGGCRCREHDEAHPRRRQQVKCQSPVGGRSVRQAQVVGRGRRLLRPRRACCASQRVKALVRNRGAVVIVGGGGRRVEGLQQTWVPGRDVSCGSRTKENISLLDAHDLGSRGTYQIWYLPTTLGFLK